MKAFNKKLLTTGTTALLLLVASFLSPLAAQNAGNVKGQVTDADGNALPGASVIIKGTTRGAATDLTGNFTMLNLKEGNQTLVINYMGFQPIEATVRITPGKTTVQNFRLTVYASSLQKVTVSGGREGQAKALNQQRNADNIKQVISADLMGRFPDLNVAEALQRLPGVTIGRDQGEGSTVQLRGTPGSFTNININGEQIMGSQETGERNAQLDLVPSNILSSMEVVKTLTPDLDGDAIAGAINLITPTATSLRTRATLDLGTGYNALRQKLNAIGNISLGKRFMPTSQMPNGRLGITGSGSYYKTSNGYDELNAQVWQSKNFNDGLGAILFPTDIRIVYLNNERTRKGATGTIDYSFSPTTSLVANVTYTDLDNATIRYRKRTRMQTANTTKTATGPYTTTRGRSYNELMNRTTSNSNINYSLEGQTTISKIKLDAGLFFTTSKQVQLADTYNFITGNIPLTISSISGDYIQPVSTSNWKNNASLFTYNTVEGNYFTTKGQNFVARLNMTYPYKIGNNDAYFKAGVKIKDLHNQRFRPSNTYVATYSGAAAAGNLNNFLGDAEVSDELADDHLEFGRGVNKDATINFYKSNPSSFTLSPDLTKVSIETYFMMRMKMFSQRIL